MTVPYQRSKTENVLGGSLLALIAIPVGVALFALISTIGIYASITGYVIAFGAVWLYGRGSGGLITRTGAWIVTGIVVVTLLLAFYVSMVVEFARAVGKDLGIGAWAIFNRPQFWPVFNENFGNQFSHNLLPFGLAMALGLLGSFRTLRRAFATSSLHTPMTPEGFTAATGTSTPGVAPTAEVGPTTQVAPLPPTSYQNDIDAAPTGSADDKTAPPTAS